jgi:two-component system LytT family response regulator
MIRAIIIDDEPLAIESLSLIMKSKCQDDVEVSATSNSPRAAKLLIERYKPDLVFLDIEMPGISGIDIARSFPNAGFHLVFVTAYDEYAIEALRLSAIDYLLKPVDSDEIIAVIQKVKNSMGKKQNALQSQLQKLESLLLSNAGKPDAKIGVAMADKIVFVKSSEILYCQANGTYTNIYLTDGKKIVSSKSLGEFETQLDRYKFFRIHHSTLINLNHIKEFKRFGGGYVTMENNAKLEVSHRKRKDFLDAIARSVI